MANKGSVSQNQEQRGLDTKQSSTTIKTVGSQNSNAQQTTKNK